MRYRQVTPTVWTSRAFSALPPAPPCARLLYLRLLTGPETTAVPGVIPVGEAALGEALRWSVRDLRGRLAELERGSIARVDRDARLIWLPSEIAANPPANPNVAKHWASVLREVPECDLRDAIIDAVIARLEGSREPFVQPFREAFPERFHERSGQPPRNNDHDHDHDHKQEHDHEPSAARPSVNGTRRTLAADEPLTEARRGIVATRAMNTGETLDAEREWELFVAHYRAEGKTVVDLDAAWKSWLIRAEGFAKTARSRARGNTPQQSALDDSAASWRERA